MSPTSTHELYGSEIATLLIPTAVTLISAQDQDGKDCVATIAWVMPISHEPSFIALAIRPGGRTAQAIRASKAFIVNVLDAQNDAVRIATVCGTKQGIEDRFFEAGLTYTKGAMVNAARIDQALSWIECELIESHVYGDHELFIGKTLSATTRALLNEDGKIEPQAALLMGQRGRFGHFEEGF